jgi:hypothetical protein
MLGHNAIVRITIDTSGLALGNINKMKLKIFIMNTRIQGKILNF